MSEDSWRGVNGSRVPDAAPVSSETVRGLPAGTPIAGEVTVSARFGVFLSIDGRPDVVGLAEIVNMPHCMEFPAVGERVSGEVLWHDPGRQVKIVLDAWIEHSNLLPGFRVGQLVIGRMVELPTIGVFFHADDCVSGGLVALPSPDLDLRQGQEVTVRITAVDPERNKILSVEPLPAGHGGAGRVPRSLSRTRHDPEGRV